MTTPEPGQYPEPPLPLDWPEGIEFDTAEPDESEEEQ